MEIGHQPVRCGEGAAWVEIQVGLTFKRPHVAGPGRRLKCPRGCGSNRNHSPSSFTSLLNTGTGLSIDRQPFGVNAMIADVFRLDWLEGSGPHMQCHENLADAFFIQTMQKSLVEVQPCRRRGHCARILCVHCLVTIPVLRFWSPVDIRWQRHLPMSFQKVRDIRLLWEPQDPKPFLSPLDFDLHPFGQRQLATGRGRTAETQLRKNPLPRKLTFHQHFDLAARRLATEKPRRDHPGIVEHQQISGSKQIRKVPDTLVLKRPGGAIHHQQATGAAVRQRVFRDSFGRQVVIEVGRLEVPWRLSRRAACAR